ncbi:hypothetical protein GCM10010388_05440 [Streptomyces mauvecolor]
MGRASSRSLAGTWETCAASAEAVGLRTGARWPIALWQETGFVFASPVGQSLVPSTDYGAWKQLLTDAKVRDGRLHDARHTAARCC